MSTETETDQESRSHHRNESLLVPDTDFRRRSDWLAAIVLVVTVSVAEGVGGAIAGLVTVGVWFGLGTPYALAAGIVFLTAQTSDGVASISVLLVSGGFLALLLAPAGTVRDPGTYAITVLFTAGAFGSLTWILVTTQPLWLTALVLLGAGVLVTYGLYRYQRLRLGLLDEEPSDADETTAAQPSEAETP
jgi:hypothetical protein